MTSEYTDISSEIAELEATIAKLKAKRDEGVSLRHGTTKHDSDKGVTILEPCEGWEDGRPKVWLICHDQSDARLWTYADCITLDDPPVVPTPREKLVAKLKNAKRGDIVESSNDHYTYRILRVHGGLGEDRYLFIFLDGSYREFESAEAVARQCV